MSVRPVRLQRSRVAGFDLQLTSIETNGLPAVYVGRPGKWGNPFNWQDCPTDVGPPEWAKGAAVDLFRDWLRGELPQGGTASGKPLPEPPTKAQIRHALRGKNLACWCRAGEPCHADVLLRIANEEASNG